MASRTDKRNDSIFDYFVQIRQSGIRVKTYYFPTLVAITQTPIYGKERRYITPRECARLQSFPEDFILPEDDKSAYKQFGNSVNVHNVNTIIKTTLDYYNFNDNSSNDNSSNGNSSNDNSSNGNSSNDNSSNGNSSNDNSSNGNNIEKNEKKNLKKCLKK